MPKYDGLPEDFRRRFTYHPPKGDQAERYMLIRDTARSFARVVCAETPSGREQSVALTRIEEAVFWANAAIARNEHQVKVSEEG